MKTMTVYECWNRTTKICTFQSAESALEYAKEQHLTVLRVVTQVWAEF